MIKTTQDSEDDTSFLHLWVWMGVKESKKVTKTVYTKKEDRETSKMI